MGSITAKEVALEVVNRVRKGTKVNVSQIAREHGYSASSVQASKVQKTATYKAIVNPVVAKLERVRANAIDAMLDKDMSTEKLATLSTVSNNLTHDIQLLSGKATTTHESIEDKRILIAIVNSLRPDNGSTTPLLDK